MHIYIFDKKNRLNFKKQENKPGGSKKKNKRKTSL